MRAEFTPEDLFRHGERGCWFDGEVMHVYPGDDEAFRKWAEFQRMKQALSAIESRIALKRAGRTALIGLAVGFAAGFAGMLVVLYL